MASGRTHRTTGLLASAALAVLGSQGGFFYEGLFLAGGCAFGAIFMNPDQDVDGGYIGNKGARAIGLERPYWVFFRPYQLAYKHRSKWSHFPILSTIWRVVYLFLPILVVAFKDQNTSRARLLTLAVVSQIMALLSWVLLGMAVYWGVTYWLIWAIIGLTINDTLHWVLDLF